MGNWISRLIDKNRGAPRSKILVRRVIDHLVRRREVLRYRQIAGDLKERVPIIVVRRRQAICIKCRIARDEIKIIARICGRRTASHPDSSTPHIRGYVEHGRLRQTSRVVPHDPAVEWDVILVRSPSDIYDPVDECKAWALVLLLRDEVRCRTAIACSRESSGDGYRTASPFIACENVDRMESLEKGWAGWNHGLGDNVERVRRRIDNGCASDADFRRNIAKPAANAIPRKTRRHGSLSDSTSVICIDETGVPKRHTRAGIRVERIKSLVLGRDENNVVICVIDRQVGDPQRLSVNSAIDGA